MVEVGKWFCVSPAYISQFWPSEHHSHYESGIPLLECFLIRFTKTHFLHPPNYDYWDVSYIVGKVWMRRLQRRWNRRKRFSNDGVIPRTSLSRWILGGD